MRQIFFLVFGIVAIMMLGSELIKADMSEPNVTYTPSTETKCWVENGKQKCYIVLYSGAMYWKDKLGNWVNASDVLEITKFQDDLTFHYDGIEGYFNVTFEAGVVYDGNYYSLSTVKSLYPSIQFDFPTKKYPANWKYAVNITDIPLNLSKIENITLTYKEHYGFTIDQLKSVGGKYLVKDLFELTFDDLLESNFEININKTEKRIYISNITLDKFVGNSLYLDPTIKLQTADTENLDDDSNYDAYNSPTIYIFGSNYQADYQPTGIKFNISSIPAGQNIDNSSLFIYIKDAGTVTGQSFEYANRTWTEESDITNTASIGSLLSTTSLANVGWVNFSVTSWVSSEYNDNYKNVSFILNHTGTALSTFWSKEYTTDTSLRPYLNITYSAISGDTCTYSSGNWAVTCSDNCTITTNVNMGNNNIILTSTGKFTIKADILNVNDITKQDGCIMEKQDGKTVEIKNG